MKFEEYERMNSFEAVNWWWVGKRDLIGKTLGKIVNHRPLILDIGCGTGSNLRSWGSHGEVLGLDNSPQALNFCRIKGNTNLLKGDAAALPFRDNTFEVIVALDLIEHMEKDADTIREFFRVCRTGGHLLLTVPALMSLWSQHDVALHHKRRYSKKELESLLSLGGFQIERLSFWNFALLPPAVIYRTLGNLNPPREARSDDLRLPGPFNAALKFVLSVENRLILEGINLPVGITLFAVCRKG